MAVFDDNDFQVLDDPSKSIKIRYGINWPRNQSAITLNSIFRRAVDQWADKPALCYEEEFAGMKSDPNVKPSKPRDQWKTWTFQQYSDDIDALGRASIAVGLGTSEACAIWGFNSPHWHIACMSTIFAGGVYMGIYPTDNPDTVAYKLKHTQTVVAFVDSKEKQQVIEQLFTDGKLNNNEGECKLKAIVCWNEPAVAATDLQIFDWESYKNYSEATAFEDYASRRDNQTPNRVVGYIYTSGTTGNPKACMLTHDNIVFIVSRGGDPGVLGEEYFANVEEQDRIISYLPLSHIAAGFCDIFMQIVYSSGRVTSAAGVYRTVYFARMYDLKQSSIVARLQAIQPTMFFGVPRVWEKIEEKMRAKAKSGVIGSIVQGLKDIQYSSLANQQVGGTKKDVCGISISKMLFSKVHAKLGLDKMKFAATGGAPIQAKTQKYFASIGININNVYGMSELTGICTFSSNSAFKWGSIGVALGGVSVEVFDDNNEICPPCQDISPQNLPEDCQGEIRVRGRGNMAGYLCNPKLGPDHIAEIEEKNKSAFTSDGWIKTGDKGAKDEFGILKITGRYKDLLIGAGGENVAPIPIENNIKVLYPGVANCMMVGDKRKFMAAVITLRAVGATGECSGTDELEPCVYKNIECAKPKLSLISEVVKDAEGDVIKAIIDAIKKTNEDGSCTPSNAAKIRKFTILPQDFSVENGDLTPSLKLKRGFCAKKYAQQIEALYDANNNGVFVNTFESC